MSGNNVNDPRIKHTIKSLRQALSTLLSTKELNCISVKELAETAKINRKTFYNYYSGIHHILDKYP